MAEVSCNSADECTPAKKAKTEKENESENSGSIHDVEFCLSAFNVKKVLQHNYMRKQIYIEGAFKGHEGPAVVLLEKQNFPDDQETLKELFDDGTILHKLYNNDIYGNYECFPLKKYNGIVYAQCEFVTLFILFSFPSFSIPENKCIVYLFKV